MADPNLIACLYPDGDGYSPGNATRTINMAENASRRIEPLTEDRSRHSSQAPEDETGNYEDEDEDDNGHQSEQVADSGYDYSPGLQLRFDDWRKNEAGFVFGTSRNCDIVLPKRDTLGNLAPRQCAIRFDRMQRLVLEDLQKRQSKKSATAVTYNGEGGQKRRGFTWILSAHQFTDDHTPIIIALHDNLKFQIVVAHHDMASASYQESVAQFPSRFTTNVEDLSFGRVGFQSGDSTAAPSGTQSPGTDAILLSNGELGRGAQAVVVRVWNVSTGLEYASKEPVSNRVWNRLKTEINLLEKISHVSLIIRSPNNTFPLMSASNTLSNAFPSTRRRRQCLDWSSSTSLLGPSKSKPGKHVSQSRKAWTFFAKLFRL